jgi:hypothetical protein
MKFTEKNSNNVDVTYNYTDGAIIGIHPSKLPSQNYFNYIKLNSDISFGRARALYDVNVAVMKIEGIFEGSIKDLTYESDFYCTGKIKIKKNKIIFNFKK